MFNPHAATKNDPTHRLQSRIDRITEEAFGLWAQHTKVNTFNAVPHLERVLPALGDVNGLYQGAPLLTFLIQRIGDQDWDTSKATAEALGKIGKTAIPELISLLRDKDRDVRRNAAEALGKMGEKAGAAVPDFLRLLCDQDKDVRSAAAKALGTWQTEWGLRIFELPNKPAASALAHILAQGQHPFPVEVLPPVSGDIVERLRVLEVEEQELAAKRRELEAVLRASGNGGGGEEIS